MNPAGAGRSAWPLGLLALVAAVHGVSLRHGFVYDDAWTVLDNPVLRDPGSAARLFGRQLIQAGVPDAGRPVLLATEMLDWLLWGRSPAGYHAQNLLWHAAVVLLLFAGLRRLIISAGPSEGPAPPAMSSARHSRAPLDAHPAVLAGIAAGLFAVHPLTVEVVAVINYREDLLVTCFLLLGLLAVAAARQATTRARGLLARLAAVLATLLACFSKENGILAPILLVLVDVFQAAATGAEPLRVTLRRRWPDHVLIAAAAALALLWRWWALGDPTLVSHTAELTASADRRLTVPLAALTWFLGLGQFLWPAWLSPEYADLPGGAGMRALGWGALALLFAGVGVSLWQRRRLGWLGLGLALSIAAYLPHLGLVALTNTRADRYFYLPAAGWCLAAAVPLSALLARRPRWGVVAAGALILVLGVRAAVQSRVWRSERSVFTAAVAMAPDVPRAWLGLARAELHAGRTLPALAAAERARALADDAQARETLGLVRMRQGDLAGARADLLRALATARPAHRARVLNNLGHVEAQLGQQTQALDRFAQARALAPLFDRPWLNTADVQRRRNDLPGARRTLEDLVAAIPQSVDGWKQLAALLEASGEKQNARAAWKRARALSPEDPAVERALQRLPGE
jgi:protein O-mannosyl-transferase